MTVVLIVNIIAEPSKMSFVYYCFCFLYWPVWYIFRLLLYFVLFCFHREMKTAANNGNEINRAETIEEEEEVKVEEKHSINNKLDRCKSPENIYSKQIVSSVAWKFLSDFLLNQSHRSSRLIWILMTFEWLRSSWQFRTFKFQQKLYYTNCGNEYYRFLENFTVHSDP